LLLIVNLTQTQPRVRAQDYGFFDRRTTVVKPEQCQMSQLVDRPRIETVRTVVARGLPFYRPRPGLSVHDQTRLAKLHAVGLWLSFGIFDNVERHFCHRWQPLGLCRPGISSEMEVPSARSGTAVPLARDRRSMNSPQIIAFFVRCFPRL
jgi:hypothetical protein